MTLQIPPLLTLEISKGLQNGGFIKVLSKKIAVINRSAERTQLMTVAVLALQGAFAEHEKILSKLGADSFEIRQKKDLDRGFDRLIIPGGESTVQGKSLRELDLFDGIKSRIEGGMPVYGAPAQVLSCLQNLSQTTAHSTCRQCPLLPTATHTADSSAAFHTEAQFEGIGEIPMTFIRAPYIDKAYDDVQVLSEVDGKIVAARQKNQLVTAFHPELDGDTRVHEYFLNM